MDTKRIEDILKSISNEVLTEEVKTAIADSFNTAVEEKVKTQAQLMVENELSKMDADHSDKLKKLVEAIDEDHTNKFKSVVQKIDESHTAKLKKIIEKYETELKNGAESLRSDLVGKISNYLDLYIEETIPTTQLKEAVENIRARKMLDEIKKIVAVDPEFISENFKDALKDGHDTIEKLREQLNNTIKESVGIKQQLINANAKLLMESKTKDLTDNKKKFVTKLLEGKTPEEIEANFTFVLEMYDHEESDKATAATDGAMSKTKTIANKVDAPKSVINENHIQPTDEVEGAQGVSSYLEELKNI
jgi:hypothetical protein